MNPRQEDAELAPSAGVTKLPEEPTELVRAGLPSDVLPMSLEEAKEHRLKLMAERSAHVKQSEAAWHAHSYSFCED